MFAPGATLAATSISSITSVSGLAGVVGAFFPPSTLTALMLGAAIFSVWK